MRVNTIYPAIQGEGCLAGTPMILVRLQGCSLRCPWCDTKDSWDPSLGHEYNIPEIIRIVERQTTGHQWVLLTGGEPLEQWEDVKGLVTGLHSKGYSVALETNGHHSLPMVFFDWVCISPKDLPPNRIQHCDELKFVVTCPEDIPDPLTLPASPHILLQPVWDNPQATQLCIDAVQEHGWRLSIQLHKLLGQP